MQSLLKHRDAERDTPLYVRWNPEHTPYIIELKLDVVRRICEEIRHAGQMETGGILIGTLPTSSTPTLRVDEVQMIQRRPEDGATFLLDPREHDRFVSTRWEAAKRGRVAVGLFRSHLRNGPLRPSLADRTLLGGEFVAHPYLLLLIEGNERRQASFFFGSATDLPDQPSVAPFRFDEADLSALPEVAPVGGRAAEKTGQRWRLVAALAFLFLAVAAAGYEWSGIPNTALMPAASNGPGLNVQGGKELQIAWNHESQSVAKAISGKLVIKDGGAQSEIPLNVSDLRAGAVQYQRRSANVEISLWWFLPDGSAVTQTSVWHGA